MWGHVPMSAAARKTRGIGCSRDGDTGGCVLRMKGRAVSTLTGWASP